METQLTNANVNGRYIDFLQGHSQKGIGGNVYMKGVKPEVLLEDCVKKIDWDIDWEKLKIDWKKIINEKSKNHHNHRFFLVVMYAFSHIEDFLILFG